MASCRLLVVDRSIWHGAFLWHVDLILPVHGLNFKGGRALGSKERSGCQDSDEPEGDLKIQKLEIGVLWHSSSMPNSQINIACVSSHDPISQFSRL
jgi:hypothetical protein